MNGITRYHKCSERSQVLSRRAVNLVLLTGLAGWPSRTIAQMSQRARQIRERRACVQNQPDCRPEIRAQLEAGRRRIRLGLLGLAGGLAVIGTLLWRRYQSLQNKQNEELQKLHSHLDKSGGDSVQNKAKSDPP